MLVTNESIYCLIKNYVHLLLFIVEGEITLNILKTKGKSVLKIFCAIYTSFEHQLRVFDVLECRTIEGNKEYVLSHFVYLKSNMPTQFISEKYLDTEISLINGYEFLSFDINLATDWFLNKQAENNRY